MNKSFFRNVEIGFYIYTGLLASLICAICIPALIAANHRTAPLAILMIQPWVIIACIVSMIFYSMYYNKKQVVLHGATSDLGYYISKIMFVSIIMTIFSLVLSALGGFLVNLFLGGIRTTMTNIVLRSCIVKLPLLLIFLFVAKVIMLERGFLDAEYTFEIVAVSTAYMFIMLLPMNIYFHIHDFYVERAFFTNYHAIFNVNYDRITSDGSVGAINIPAIIASLVFIAIIEGAVILQSYRRGQQIYRHYLKHEYDDPKKAKRNAWIFVPFGLLTKEK